MAANVAARNNFFQNLVPAWVSSTLSPMTNLAQKAFDAIAPRESHRRFVGTQIIFPIVSITLKTAAICGTVAFLGHQVLPPHSHEDILSIGKDLIMGASVVTAGGCAVILCALTCVQYKNQNQEWVKKEQEGVKKE